jgi:hypothetical protein
VMARPYPLRSSAEPTLLFFDIESKYAAIILSGNVIKDVPTIIYVPYHYHYSPNFKVWTTGGQMEWDKENQRVYWYPSTDKQTNLIVIGKDQELKAETLPEKVKELQDKITTVNSFS